MEVVSLVKHRLLTLLVLGTFVIQIISRTVQADSHDCARNLTRFEEIETPLDFNNIIALPLDDWVENPLGGFFQYRQWLFPSLKFSCDQNISRFILRTERTNYTMNSPPQLSIWRPNGATPDLEDYNRIHLINTTDSDKVLVQEQANILFYTLDPPHLVMADDFIGIELIHNGRESHKIHFLDKGEGNASISYHRKFGNEVYAPNSVPPSFGSNTSSYVPLVGAQFVEDTVTTVTSTEATSIPTFTTDPPPTTTGPTETTTSPPGQPSMVDVGLIAGVVVAVLFLILIVVLVVMIVLVMLRKKTQQKIYEVPFEPAPPNMDNPMYQGVVPEPTASQTPISESNGDSYHIYATPSPTEVESPHPPAEGHQALTISQNHHYEFSEGYSPNTIGSHYEVEPVPTSPFPHKTEDPEYAQPTVTIQPYEVPVTALQSSQDKRGSPTSDGSKGDGKEHIYSVLEEGIYVPTEEERQSLTSAVPQPYSTAQAPVINGTIETTTGLDRTTLYSTLGKKYEGSLKREGFFQQEDSYWRPASSKTALYDQLSSRKYREIVRQQIQIIKHLGSGQFGTVNMGLWQTSLDTMEVAVKTLQPMASETDKVKFLQEAAIMGQFLHPNVVKLYGVVTVGEPVMIVLEYMQKGDLRNYLLAKRPQPGELVPDDLSNSLLRFCREISAGMNYLANKAFVHRDLAARNILLSAETTCKIGDFGMSRDLEQSNYYITHGGKIPVKWTSPEALNFRKYSTASDVWSYGCVMYEIWSLAHKPFEGYTNLQCMQLIGSGFRLAPPPGCPRPLYELMIRCWHSDSSVRPTFSAIFNMLSHSPSHLLSWSARDLGIHPQVACLGAPLEVTEELYPELQDYYVDRRNQGRNKKGTRTADW